MYISKIRITRIYNKIILIIIPFRIVTRIPRKYFPFGYMCICITRVKLLMRV